MQKELANLYQKLHILQQFRTTTITLAAAIPKPRPRAEGGAVPTLPTSPTAAWPEPMLRGEPNSPLSTDVEDTSDPQASRCLTSKLKRGTLTSWSSFGYTRPLPKPLDEMTPPRRRASPSPSRVWCCHGSLPYLFDQYTRRSNSGIRSTTTSKETTSSTKTRGTCSQ